MADNWIGKTIKYLGTNPQVPDIALAFTIYGSMIYFEDRHQHDKDKLRSTALMSYELGDWKSGYGFDDDGNRSIDRIEIRGHGLVPGINAVIESKTLRPSDKEFGSELEFLLAQVKNK